MFGASFLAPLRRLLRFAPRFVELDEPFVGAVKVIPLRCGDSIFPCHHPQIAFEQQWFRFGVFFLAGQGGAQQAVDAESLPVVRLFLSIQLKGLARAGLALGELPLRLVG